MSIITRNGPEGFELTIGLCCQIKSLSVRPLILCVQISTLHLPCHVQIRMMAFRLSHRSDLVGKRERLRKILERIESFKMSFCSRPTSSELRQQRLHTFGGEGGTPPAGDTLIVG